jgi:hypothetical protein
MKRCRHCRWFHDQSARTFPAKDESGATIQVSFSDWCDKWGGTTEPEGGCHKWECGGATHGASEAEETR